MEQHSKAACCRADPLKISWSAGTGTHISPYLFGENLEHTRSNIFMGLSAQMLRNRKFAGKPMACSGHAMEWYAIGEKTFFAQRPPYTRHSEKLYHMKRQLESSAQCIVNRYGLECGMGQHELPLLAGRTYEFRMVAKVNAPMDVHIALTDRNGKNTYADGVLHLAGNAWNTYELCLTTETGDVDGDLRITFCQEGWLCIGAVSLMAAGHFRGMRRDVADALKELGIGILRWPGGNFAGEYCWADGLLPVDMRAPFESYQHLETQPHSLGFDFHEINTDDFIALCREIGAEPFITINPAWNTPEENAAWVEYCNGHADTPYGALRAERGQKEPYHVRFWSLGNEFGYGHMEGDNTPGGYSRIARSHAEKMLEADNGLQLCSSGPYPQAEWAEHAANALQDVAPMVSLHYYAPSPTYEDPEKLREEYENCLHAAETARKLVHELRSQLKDDLKISFDEWNTWYAWYRPSSIVDGMFTALMLHMILQEAERSGIGAACHFEAVNEGMMQVRPEGTELTASGQAFALMKHHANAELLHAAADCAVSRKGNVITATVVNAAFDQARKILIPADGNMVHACLYTGEQVAPFTRFSLQDAVISEDHGMRALEMPPHSLLLVQIEMETKA